MSRSTTRSLRKWFVVHKWTSLVCTIFMLLLCITGLPLIFAHEIDHALGRAVDPPELSGDGVLAADAAPPSGKDHLATMIADAQARRPGDAVQFVVRDPHEPELTFLRTGATIDAAEATGFYTYDARTGAFLNEYPLGDGFMHVMLRLHVDLFMGLPGTLFLGFMGLLMLVAIASGVVLYGPYMRKLRFGTVRRKRTVRIKWLDVHNLLGMVTLVWLTVVGLTGVINTLSAPLFAQWQATELAEMVAPYASEEALEPGPASRAVAAAEAAAPDMRLSFMAFPGNSFAGTNHYVAFMQGNIPLTSKLLTPMLVDGRRGEVVERRELPWYVTGLLLSQPLHFGDYGGLPLKILWAVLDVLAIVVLASGLVLWFRRRKVTFEEWARAFRAVSSSRVAEDAAEVA